MTDAELLSVLRDTASGLGPTEGYGPAIAHLDGLIAERNLLRDAHAEIGRRHQVIEHQLDRLQTTVGFFASVIKSGEGWSPECEAALASTRATVGTDG